LPSLALQTDGRILLGGNFNTLGSRAIAKLGRLNADASIDPTFAPGAASQVFSLSLQSDGRLVVGGNLSSLAGGSCNGVGRLLNTEPTVASLTYSNSAVLWLRSGTGPEVARVSFEGSINGQDWNNLGTAARVPGGWQLSGVANQPLSVIRARGWFSTGDNNSGMTFVESQLQVIPKIQPASVWGSPGSSQFGFNIIGSPGSAVVIDTSTNLTDWVPLLTNTFATNTVSFRDTTPGGFPARFYRARSP
jgi:hypothetical protein